MGFADLLRRVVKKGDVEVAMCDNDAAALMLPLIACRAFCRYSQIPYRTRSYDVGHPQLPIMRRSLTTYHINCMEYS